MKEVTLDLQGMETLDEFHDHAQKVLSFPAYYGRNKDAFWDCLTELPVDTTIQVTGLSDLPDAIKAQIEEYLAMLDEYSTETGGEFQVLRL